jgi:hypothetical protein
MRMFQIVAGGQPMRAQLAPMIGCSAFFAGMVWTLFV